MRRLFFCPPLPVFSLVLTDKIFVPVLHPFYLFLHASLLSNFCHYIKMVLSLLIYLNCCIIIVLTFGVGFSPYLLPGICHCDSIPQIIVLFLILLMGCIYYFLSLCCLLWLPVLNLIFEGKSEAHLCHPRAFQEILIEINVIMKCT